ncbi:hypothetical protein [Thermococcus sp.]|uniref:hypothetical protein n=1 Tax=Thermococcus sp. TaxID=35749 RepID=UPI002613681F|nr:hypothetical protein [Thermococcus sp.]MCD6143625.1 hypothetical protein [Thermococcus sp.]
MENKERMMVVEACIDKTEELLKRVEAAVRYVENTDIAEIMENVVDMQREQGLVRGTFVTTSYKICMVLDKPVGVVRVNTAGTIEIEGSGGVRYIIRCDSCKQRLQEIKNYLDGVFS